MRFLVLGGVLAAGCVENGVSRIYKRDVYSQDSGTFTVDYLWVVDNSGSMSEEQSNVVAGISGFTSVLSGFGADWQVGVITTDLSDDDAGALVAPLLASTDADFEARFAEAVAVGIDGDVTEEGLDAMALATSDGLLQGANAGLIRDDAALEVIFVSDEDDQSPETTLHYVQLLEDLKGIGNARVSAVVGDLPEGCASPYAAADPATRYHEVSVSLSGFQDSICRKDLTDTMRSLALNGLGLTDTFPLTAVPDLESMEVRVDEVLVHQRDLNGWRYDAGENAVILDGYAIPGPGSEVSIRYYEWLGHDDGAGT